MQDNSTASCKPLHTESQNDLLTKLSVMEIEKSDGSFFFFYFVSFTDDTKMSLVGLDMLAHIGVKGVVVGSH